MKDHNQKYFKKNAICQLFNHLESKSAEVYKRYVEYVDREDSLNSNCDFFQNEFSFISLFFEPSKEHQLLVKKINIRAEEIKQLLHDAKKDLLNQVEQIITELNQFSDEDKKMFDKKMKLQFSKLQNDFKRLATCLKIDNLADVIANQSYQDRKKLQL